MMSKRNWRKRRKHGFLSRMRTPGGRRVINRRRSRGRHALTVAQK